MNGKSGTKPWPGWKQRIHTVIFEAETPAGRVFDVFLLLAILASVLVVLWESVESIRAVHGELLLWMEWGFTVLFTVEYALRLICLPNPRPYAKSFYGIVDLLAILPTYLSLLLGSHPSFLVVRGIRLLRMFRIFKLVRFSSEGEVLLQAMYASRAKITVFITAVMITVVIMGAAMYLVEGQESGFSNIPTGMYWAIVTMTTVGYGDLTPQTLPGKILSSVIMILGYGLIAVPTGIVSVEIAHAAKLSVNTTSCPNCGKEGHERDAVHCRFCGHKL